MGVEKEFLQVKFFSGFIYGKEEIYLAVKKRLELFFSQVDLESDVIDFDFTTYYHEEMGICPFLPKDNGVFPLSSMPFCGIRYLA